MTTNNQKKIDELTAALEEFITPYEFLERLEAFSAASFGKDDKLTKSAGVIMEYMTKVICRLEDDLKKELK